MAKSCLFFVTIMFMLPIVDAATLVLSAPSSLVEDSAAGIFYSIHSDSPFDGSLSFTPTNVQLTPSSISFSSASFMGTYVNGTFMVTAQDGGSYSLVSTLINTSSGSTLSTVVLSGEVNSSNPRIVSISPSGILSTTTVLLSVRTDEYSTCKYSTNDTSYDTMPSTFTFTNALSHNSSLTLGEGGHTYYVRCKDTGNHVMNLSSLIQFTIDLPPTASVSLSDPSPTKAGTIEVTLLLSESISNPPILQYNFDDTTAKKTIPLTGSGSQWKGFIVISDSDNGKVGAFYLSATDSSGNTGTSITSGNIFLVDTQKPQAPTSIKSTVLSNGDVRLDWYYDGEEVDHYNIYRSVSSGVQYVDYYTKSSDTNSNTSRRYTDTSTVEQATYYYKVSAIDKAGNEGPLSEEVYATSISISSSTQSASQTQQTQTSKPAQETPRVLPPNLVPRVNDQVKKIDKTLLDIDAAYSALSQSDPQSAALIGDFAIKAKMEIAKSSLQALKAQALELKNFYSTKEELEQKLSAIDQSTLSIERSTITSASVKSRADLSQTISKEDIAAAANYILENSVLTEEEKERYIKLNDKQKGKVSVGIEVQIIQFTLLDGSSKQQSYIKKNISHAQALPLQDVVLFDFVPKAIAASASELNILTPNFEVVEEDPVIKFGFLNFKPEGETISYTLDKEINIEDLKAGKTVMLLSLSELTSSSGSSITGFAINPLAYFKLSQSESFLILAGVLTIVILTGYYFVFLDGFENLSRGARRKYQFAKLGGMGQLARNSSLDATPHKLSLSDHEASNLLHELYTHIDVAKKNATDQLIPALFSLHNKLDARKSIHGLSVHEMIHLAHYHADKKNIAKAAQLYGHINTLYATLPKDIKAAIFDECTKLHQKIHEKKH